MKGPELLQIWKMIKYNERWRDQTWGTLWFIQEKGKINVIHIFNPSPQEQRQGIAMSIFIQDIDVCIVLNYKTKTTSLQTKEKNYTMPKYVNSNRVRTKEGLSWRAGSLHTLEDSRKAGIHELPVTPVSKLPGNNQKSLSLL